ncbi:MULTISPECIES: NAD(P)H-binding protein [Streptomyces]|uniref:NAD(P)-dependent oxidoreductase n=1 Tax=Streptomyces luteosporeus TaxID=173856 RepID=A0ABN3TJK4_9ACTN
MRITVFGAAGSVGSRIVAEALQRGHEVTAVVRDAARFGELPPGARHRTGDASVAADVTALGAGQNLVVGATRPAAGREDDHGATATGLLAGLAGTGVRLLVVGGAGSLVVRDSGKPVYDDPRYVPAAWRGIALASVRQFEVFRNAGTAAVDWTYLSPPALLEPGARTGTYRAGRDELLVDAAGRSEISVEDLAVAVLDEAEHPRRRGRRFTVAY